ncbi:1,6-anhydro-N-acetylmuramyl-L-alanine amidase AmpD [Undibacterium seohonense]|jgi:AmpD protein|uniref:1,6-anhydro-N-acetylmuramyl-L-alanine amidase AmpD n=1 Tax=Undibacterium seohonense TaxID=1344950 RepID=A0ABR6X256_9BURK|nr:1,6-anhydro-N-acetylmuramyl-L-alanine amidase AmpD [Undibacterium seohonense]MBC3806461.1 1,6-anhydro-N-acetylmuramyl-L-alanine amidase AmpD [Undibacterium seohonense]
MLTRTKPFSSQDPADAWAIDDQGWCRQAQVRMSPNFGIRPADMPVDLLVIHNISLPLGEFGDNYILDLFQNQLDCDAHPSFNSLRGLQVSSHFLIRRDGQVLQFVSTLARAWHAGLSHFDGRDGCNDFSIGIELEGCDTTPFTDAQYSSLSQLSLCLIRHFPLSHIVGHEEIAPGRKTDPGPFFSWSRYQQSLPGWLIEAPIIEDVD